MARVSLVNGTSRGLVLDIVRSRGPISKPELATATGLTQATMSTVVRRLLDEGLVIESGRRQSSGGKPPTLIAINPQSRFAIGIQLGRESITYVAVDLGGAVVGRVHTVGVALDSPTDTISAIARRVGAMVASLGISKDLVVGVGLASPGPLDLDRGVILSPPRLAQWRNVPIRDVLADALGLPVVLDNDATAAAVGEFWAGRLGEARSHATIYMSVGLGAGVILDGTVFRGASSNAGELSQMMYLVDGERVALDDIATPDAIVRRAHTLIADGTAPGLSEVVAPAEPNSDAIVRTFSDFVALSTAAVQGNREAEALIDHSAQHLAAGAVSMANLFDLDSISLAGPAFQIAGPIYARALRSWVEAQFFARDAHGVRTQLSSAATDAAAIGAAAMVLQHRLAPRSMGVRAIGLVSGE
jgi:predicted NBD/HSP70 family sugar kinase